MATGAMLERVCRFLENRTFFVGIILTVGGIVLAMLDPQAVTKLKLWTMEITTNTGVLLAVFGGFFVARGQKCTLKCLAKVVGAKIKR